MKSKRLSGFEALSNVAFGYNTVKGNRMIQLTPQQIEAVKASGDAPLTLIDPQSQTAYVLVRKDAFDELTVASQEEVERLAACIDWQSARQTLRPAQEWYDGDEPKPF
jgi:hypothetical protein